MAKSSALRMFVVFGVFFASAKSCHLGYNIIGIQASRPDQYEISCGQRALPICPKVCSWTQQTCEEYATRRHWNKTHLVVTNMTYSYPLKASGYPRDDPGVAKVKSLHRRCCLADNIEATKCISVAWKADQTNSKFDVISNAKSNLKCATNNAYIRDIQQRSGIQRTFNVDLCCLKYPKDHDARVACQAPKNGETQAGVDAAAKIALGVSLPLALGIGIPLLLVCNAERTVQNIICSDPSDYVNEISESECCQLCVKQNYDACNYLGPAAAIRTEGAGSKAYCELCRGTVSRLPASDPEEIALIPRK